MSSAKKFKDHYPIDKTSTKFSEADSVAQKKEIEVYKKKIETLLVNDPSLQKKAALLIEKWINK